MKKDIIRINQTEITRLRFKKKDVLLSDKDKRTRLKKLRVAVMRKKTKDGTVRLIIESAKRGLFEVESLILMAGRDFVMLAGGQTVPVKAIKKIKL